LTERILSYPVYYLKILYVDISKESPSLGFKSFSLGLYLLKSPFHENIAQCRNPIMMDYGNYKKLSRREEDFVTRSKGI